MWISNNRNRFINQMRWLNFVMHSIYKTATHFLRINVHYRGTYLWESLPESKFQWNFPHLMITHTHAHTACISKMCIHKSDQNMQGREHACIYKSCIHVRTVGRMHYWPRLVHQWLIAAELQFLYLKPQPPALVPPRLENAILLPLLNAILIPYRAIGTRTFWT